MNVKYLNLEYFFNELVVFLGTLPEKLSFLKIILDAWKSVYVYVSIALFLGIILVVFKVSYLGRKRIKSYIDVFLEEESPEERSGRWEEIKRHMDSEIASEWKIAIIEADALMNDILKRTGYDGDSLGERLKKIEPSDFENLQNIWEAHKVRNSIAHEGTKYNLSKNDAKSAIEKYEKAMQELKYI